MLYMICTMDVRLSESERVSVSLALPAFSLHSRSYQSLFRAHQRGINSVKARESIYTYSSLMEHPPPVPVTHPKVQNLAHSEGMRLAGCSGSEDVTS